MNRIVAEDIETEFHMSPMGGYGEGKLELIVYAYSLETLGVTQARDMLVDRMEDAILRYADKIREERKRGVSNGKA